MRITNNIILHNTSININGNKGNVDTLNNQMTSQKKIQRPSDDPDDRQPENNPDTAGKTS